MPVKCPPEIFKQFYDRRGEEVCPNEAGQEFIYHALAEEHDFTGIVPIFLPELENDILRDWEKFEYWCDDVQYKLLWKLIDEGDFYDLDEDSTPIDFFGSINSITEKILSILRDPANEDSQSLVCSEIESDGLNLFLIYLGSWEGWGLGHSNTVLVLDTLEELTMDKGFYTQL
jgi:hypothetical protein